MRANSGIFWSSPVNLCHIQGIVTFIAVFARFERTCIL